ncbi:MAG: ATP synthase F0 subunit B [Proteobacteria bacterium]|nr:ATP synthase F0 subunit B [Pseudomonadota bacterium]
MEHGRFGEIFNYGVLHLEWPTALFIFVAFMVTMFLLNHLLFAPILRTLDAREAEVNKNNEKVKSLEQKIEMSEKGYQDKIRDLQILIQDSRQKALNEAMDEAKVIISKARDNAEQTLAEAEKELSTIKNDALKEAAQLTGKLAELINTKAIS